MVCSKWVVAQASSFTRRRSTRRRTYISSIRSPQAIRARCMWSSGTARDSITAMEAASYPQTSRSSPCRPTALNLGPVEEFWDIVKDTICNKVWPTLEALEEKITVTLRKYWEDTSRVMSLFLNSYLRFELNGSKKTISYFIKLNGIR